MKAGVYCQSVKPYSYFISMFLVLITHFWAKTSFFPASLAQSNTLPVFCWLDLPDSLLHQHLGLSFLPLLSKLELSSLFKPLAKPVISICLLVCSLWFFHVSSSMFSSVIHFSGDCYPFDLASYDSSTKHKE